MTDHDVSSPAAPPRSEPWLLLAEMEHRVVNEYAVAISAISAAATRSSNADVRTALADAARRLGRYAAAHRALQLPIANGRLDLSDYLRRLCVARAEAGLAERGIQLILIEQPVCLEADRCWRVGLVVSELINNAMRHAFNGDQGERDPAILVELGVGGGAVQVRVSDNGRSAAAYASGSGSKIVDALAADLGGSVERSFGDAGGSVLLWVPI